MALEFQSFFEHGLPYADWLQRFGTADHRARWGAVHARLKLTDEQRDRASAWKRKMHVLCLAGAWCGDCVRQCPHLQVIAAANPVVDLRFVDRDDQPALQSLLQICGGNRVPVVVFMAEDFAFCGLYGDRVLSTYQRMAAEQTGAACPTGLIGDDDSYHANVLADWFQEFDRVELMLRLSGRLRQKHGD